MPHNALTIPAMVARAAEVYSDRSAVEDGETRLDFATLHARARDACKAFLGAGLTQGDRFAIWAPNIWEWIVAALGGQYAGGTLVPVNTRFKGGEGGYVLEKSGARFLFTVEGFLDTDYVAMLRGARGDSSPEGPVAGLPHLDRIVVLRGTTPPGTRSWDDFREEGAGITDAAVDAAMESVDPGDLSDILFTSGTTGSPKGVMTGHEQNLRAYRSWSEVVGLWEGDRYLIVNPFFHAFGYKAGWLSAIMRGATVIPHQVFDVPQVLARVPEDEVSVLPGPPALYQAILAHPDLDTFDLSSLRLAVTGAATIPVELIERMRDRLGFETIITGYGLTESCGIVTMCRFDDDPETIARSSGRAIPDVEVRIVTAGGVEVPPGEPGEVVVRGYNVMQGYLDDAEATAETIDSAAWLHTGDIGVMDENGYIRITDRKKDMFIMGGFNCYPAEIENLMLANEDLVQVAVIGVPDERMGEVGHAFVVARPDVTLTEDEIVAWCRDNMANFKVPRKVTLVDALPLNATGKVQKFVLREMAADRT
ncbi:MAG: fatty acid--CoA ligase family protein [Acidimicrobiia bacterium]|nr:fatty acid--CoA ligase family protein [Acidimicrobiia bacterium]